MGRVKPIHHTLDIYDVEIHLAWTPRQWAALAEEFTFLPEDAPACAGQVSVATHVPDEGLSRYHVVLWINGQNHVEDRELVDTIAHESSHAAGRILDRIGHDYRDGSEPHSYLIGWLSGWIWSHLHS